MSVSKRIGPQSTFAAGVSVSIYRQDVLPSPSLPPPGPVISTVVVQTDSTFTATGLDAGQSYLAYAAGRALSFRADDYPVSDTVGEVIDTLALNFLEFGAVGDGATDNIDAWEAAVSEMSSDSSNRGMTLLVPYGIYRFSRTPHATRQLVLQGESGAGWYPGTEFLFPDGVTGLIVDRAASAPDGQAGDWSVIRDIAFVAEGKAVSGADGVYLKARAKLENCYITGFSRDGLHIEANNTDVPATNANNWRVDNLRIDSNGRYGMYCDGADVNAGVAVGVDSSQNGQWGIYDSSFLGNTYLGCHTAQNGTAGAYGGYKSDGGSNLSVFVGCYTESGQGASNSIASPALLLGPYGDVTNAGSAPTIRVSGGALHSPTDVTTDGNVSLLGAAKSFLARALTAETTIGFALRVAGDAADRLRFSPRYIEAGDGTATPDTSFDRIAAAIWRVTNALQFPERSDPSAPSANNVITYAKDNGSGKTQYAVRFNSGGVRPLATEGGETASVASAAALTLPMISGRVFTITGTTNITSVVATDWTGQTVTLIFAGILTFTDGSNLKLAGNFVTTADDTITLACDGTNWHEVARSIN